MQIKRDNTEYKINADVDSQTFTFDFRHPDSPWELFNAVVTLNNFGVNISGEVILFKDYLSF